MARQATRRKPTLVVHHNKTYASPALSNDDRQAQRYGEVILRGIMQDSLLTTVDYFTRESLLLHFADFPAFGRVSTITRYTMIREGVSWLVKHGKLIRPNNSRKNLCLPNHERRAVKALTSPLPLHLRYYDHIHNIIRHDTDPNCKCDVMSLVHIWQEGSPGNKLTEDNMRVIVRQTLRGMYKAPNALLRENNDYTYTTLPLLYEKEIG